MRPSRGAYGRDCGCPASFRCGWPDASRCAATSPWTPSRPASAPAKSPRSAACPTASDRANSPLPTGSSSARHYGGPPSAQTGCGGCPPTASCPSTGSCRTAPGAPTSTRTPTPRTPIPSRCGWWPTNSTAPAPLVAVVDETAHRVDHLPVVGRPAGWIATGVDAAPHRPQGHRDLATARPPPPHHRTHHGLTRRMATPAPPLRTQGRPLPRLHRHRLHLDLPPQTHHLRRVLNISQTAPQRPSPTHFARSYVLRKT